MISNLDWFAHFVSVRFCEMWDCQTRQGAIRCLWEGSDVRQGQRWGGTQCTNRTASAPRRARRVIFDFNLTRDSKSRNPRIGFASGIAPDFRFKAVKAPKTWIEWIWRMALNSMKPNTMKPTQGKVNKTLLLKESHPWGCCQAKLPQCREADFGLKWDKMR